MLKQDELLDMRKRILGGYDPSEEEIEQILSALRENRGKVQAAGSSNSTRATKKAAAMPLDLNELFKKDEKK